MATVKGKTELCRTENYKTYFKSIQGLGSYTLFDRYDAIENVVNKNIDERYRHFLAQPVIYDDSITWFSKPYNETPQQLSSLRDGEEAKYEQVKNDTVAHYKTIIHSLRQEGKSPEADSLEGAIKFINNHFVYCFDGKTVLGVWGMQLRDEVRDPLGIAMKNLFVRKKSKPENLPAELPDAEMPVPATLPELPPENLFTVRFKSGGEGTVKGISELTKYSNEIITEKEIPEVEAKAGYRFTGWNKNPNNYPVTGHTEFTALYSKLPPVAPVKKLFWYQRVWRWLVALFTGEGSLKWLLLLLLLLLLFWWLFRSCSGDHASPIPYPVSDKPFLHNDPRAGKGGIYNPGDPYKPVPTPPDYRNVLPPEQGVLPPLDSAKIVRDSSNRSVISNRLNILMENEDKSIMDLAKDFKAKYPDDKYKIVYYDDVVKRMQVEVPAEEREKLKQEIPGKFAPDYKLFVFDEALFEGSYTPDDPAFSDPQKSWYLKAINAPQAWDITRGSRKHTIAIIDNGFSLNHPELQSKVVMPYNVWLHSKEIFAQQFDHGTHVAGTALAIMNNKQGLCGIASECAFMPVQVANKQGIMTTTSTLDGILYALYQGADVVNVSLGMQFTGSLPDNVQHDLQDNHFKEEERLWNEIMKISDKHKAIIVVAAGNDNMLAGVNPMNRPKNFVIVSAVDKNNREYRKAGFSNYGNYSTVSGPGVDIYSTVGNNGYTSMDGTSMATPIVSGAIALMKSLNENLTAEQIICILQSTGVAAVGKIGNLIQLDKALKKVQSGNFTDCSSRSPQTPSTGDVQVLLNWKNYNDLDLACVDPTGDTVWFKNKKVPSGGLLEIDMNVQPHNSKTPIENIYWPHGSAPKGTYQVYLRLYKEYETGINETPYKITAKYGDQTKEFTGSIKKEEGRIRICTFTLGDTNDPQNPDTVLR